MSELTKRLITGFLLGILVLVQFPLSPFFFLGTLTITLGVILFLEWPTFFKGHDWRFWAIIPLYPIMPLAMMAYLQVSGYELLNLLLIVMTAGHDTGAYLVGKQYGRRAINKAISPNKTWEGFLGGVLLSLILSAMFFWHNPWPLIVGATVPLVIGVNFAVLAGDLFESLLKRQAHVKDTGTLLPGHGGLLDRIDGLLFATVPVFLARKWILLLCLP